LFTWNTAKVPQKLLKTNWLGQICETAFQILVIDWGTQGKNLGDTPASKFPPRFLETIWMQVTFSGTDDSNPQLEQEFSFVSQE
jgi:hypothetical protein